MNKVSKSERTVTGAELAAILGDVTPPTISRLRKSGVFKCDEHGRYNAAESVKAYIAHKERRLHEGKSNDRIISPLRAEKLRVQIDLLKHTFSVETGKAHDKVLCCQSLIAMFAAESRILASMAARVASKFPEQIGLKLAIEAETDAVLARLHDGSAYDVHFQCPHCYQPVEQLIAVEPTEASA